MTNYDPEFGGLSATRFLNKVIFLPEVYEEMARIVVFADDCETLESYYVKIGFISVDHPLRSDHNETSVDFYNVLNPNSLAMRIALRATILVPRREDLDVWGKFIHDKYSEFTKWKAYHPKPRRVLPPED